MLELMSPWEYTSAVRPVLGHGSGFDSPGWKAVRRALPDLGAAFHIPQVTGPVVVDVYRRAMRWTCTSWPRR
jgi:tryptophan 2,3-dioxygenase